MPRSFDGFGSCGRGIEVFGRPFELRGNLLLDRSVIKRD